MACEFWWSMTKPIRVMLLNAILTRCGGVVKCCESTAQALKEFRTWKPDLLVSDIGMPVEDGYTLIRKLRKLRLKAAKEIPAIALTAYANKEDKARALASGFQIHVPKPIEPAVAHSIDCFGYESRGLKGRSTNSHESTPKYCFVLVRVISGSSQRGNLKDLSFAW